jgi:hypothetical protein
MAGEKASVYEKEMYKKLQPMLGIDSKVVRYWDEINSTKINILSVSDPIDKNVTFYGALALNEQAPHNEYELLMASYSKNKFAPNILSTCAFYVIKNKWKTNWGNVFETLVTEYYPKSNLKHIYFTKPFIWEDKLENFTADNKKVNLFSIGYSNIGQ